MDIRERAFALGTLANTTGGADCRFTLRVAGHTVGVRCFFEQTKEGCRNYLIADETPEFTINITRDDLAAEIADAAGHKPPTREQLGGHIAIMNNEAAHEPIVLARKVANTLLDCGILLMHGAAIALDGKCFLFTAPSRTGKTTHIMNWLKVYPDTIVVNGDKPLIHTGTKLVYGTPWCGKEGLNTNTSVPLAGIIALERGVVNEITPVPFREMLPLLLKQTHLPGSGIQAIRVCQQLDRLKDVPCYRLHCNMEEESAIVASRGLGVRTAKSLGEEKP